ncbi:MAG: MMPL family transporter [Candidatus Omnitrophica bacterium]|nr:MMPL family transporter [Candidatus Omnitrophota bacterium]
MRATDRFVEASASFLTRHRTVIAWSVILPVSLFSFFALSIRFENSVESFISPHDPDRAYYNAFKREFGDDQPIVLAIPLGDVFTRENLEKLDSVSKGLADIPLVRKVRSVTKTQDIVGTEGGFEVLPFIDKIPEDPAKLRALKISALANPLYKIDLISPDGSIASIMIEPETSPREDRYKEIVRGIRKVMERSALRGKEFYLAGDPLVELQMTEDMWKDLKTFIPATYGCLFLLLLFLFRSVKATLLLLAVISLCMGWLMGFMGASGIPMNAVTVGLPSLMLCISVLDCIHIFAAYCRFRSEELTAEQSIESALRENIEPCWLTTLTTVVGFICLCVSELIPIRQFGFLGACSILAAYPISLATLPYFMGLIRRKLPLSEKSPGRNFLLERLPAFSMKVPAGLMIAALAAAIGISAWGAGRIRVETNHLKFLRERSPVRIASDYIESRLGGVSPLEIIVETPADDMIKEPRVLKEIDRFQQFMESLPEVDKTVSPVQFIKEMHQAMNEERPDFYFIPDSRNLIAQYLLTYSFSGRDNDLDDFVDYTYRKARIRGRMKQQSSAQLRSTLAAIDSFARSNFSPDLKVRITSHSLLQANMVDILVKGQVGGLGTELLLMMLIFSLVHGSWLVGLFSLLPNILPLIFSAGFMGFAGISLNAGTAMTMGIAFGLVVDDTVHFFHHAARRMREKGDIAGITRRIFESVGLPVLFTSLLLTAGFGILVFGQSYLTLLFGMICSFTILSALLCELVISPFLLRFSLLQRGLRRNDNKRRHHEHA